MGAPVSRRLSRSGRGRPLGGPAALFVAALAVAAGVISAPVGEASASGRAPSVAGAASDPVGNFTASINRLVDLVGLAGSGLLALVWARVALSWFSNDLSKKIQAKDRARDALVGTLLFVAAVTGLVWALAHWVVTGS